MPEDINQDACPVEYKLLFNINKMTDRGPTSTDSVEGLKLWSEDILKQKAQKTIKCLSTINNFYCGKHFHFRTSWQSESRTIFMGGGKNLAIEDAQRKKIQSLLN